MEKGIQVVLLVVGGLDEKRELVVGGVGLTGGGDELVAELAAATDHDEAAVGQDLLGGVPGNQP